MGQKRFLYQSVQVVQSGAIDPKQIIGFSGQGPGADNFRLAGNQMGEGFAVLGLVPVEMNLYKGLNGQAKPGWIKPGCIADNIAGGVKLMPPSTGLAGRQTKDLTKLI